MNIAEVGREWEAMQAAERGDWKPLAKMLETGVPLGSPARQMLAAKLVGAYKTRRGPKQDMAANHKNQALYLEFMRLRITNECPSNETAYATIAVDQGRTPDAIRKAVEAGRQTFSPTLRLVLEERRKQLEMK